MMTKGLVVVTGAAGFIGSWLVMKLLQKGYTVRATVRDPSDERKAKSLLDLPGSGDRLSLWKADLTEDGSFDAVVTGASGVFHCATPMDFDAEDPEGEVIKPTIDGVLNIMRSCKRSATVRRVVFTSSAGAVNVHDGPQLPAYDESCWTDVDFCRRVKMTGWMYFVSKTLAERAAWVFAGENDVGLVVVIPPLVVGPFITGTMPPSLITALSPITGNEAHYSILKQHQLVHVDDLCEAEIFLYEHPAAEEGGRYICSSHDATIFDVASVIRDSRWGPCYRSIPASFPGIDPDIPRVHFSSEKLVGLGFGFKYSVEEMFDAAIETCREKKLLLLETADELGGGVVMKE